MKNTRFTLLRATLCALFAGGLLFLSGCSEDPAQRIHRAAKAAALAVLAEDAGAVDDLERIAATVDGLTSGDVLSDAVIASVLGELVERGDIDRRQALIFAGVAQELWDIFRPADGVLQLDPKRRAAIAGFAAGIREAVAFSRALDGTAAGATPTAGVRSQASGICLSSAIRPLSSDFTSAPRRGIGVTHHSQRAAG